MPTYAYRCPACGHEFSRFHKMNVRTRPRCPQCGAVAERMITGGAGLLFRGSGFYITDYKKGAEQAGAADKADKADTSAGTTESAAKPKKHSPPKKGADS
jgi:putative FmdB family regulatory protein